jgi:hypothetical protein
MLQDLPELPDGLDHLWRCFLELHGSRGSTTYGAARITYMDIDAFCRVTSTRLLWWELQAIRAADNAYLAREAERSEREMRKAKG